MYVGVVSKISYNIYLTKYKSLLCGKIGKKGMFRSLAQ